MSNSSQQPDYLTISQIDSISTIVVDPTNTIDISSINFNSGAYAGGTVTIASGSGGSSGSGYISSATISSISITDNTFTNTWVNNEWVNSFPDWNRIQKMCEQYPGLKIAFEKFKTTYKLVQDDFDTPPEKRIKP